MDVKTMPANPNTVDIYGRFAIGLSLAVLSTFFIGASFIIKKIGLKRLTKKGYLRAGSGGYGYLREWVWWAGLICMGMGEAFNFSAYAFVPASLVTPLGALSILVTAILASKFLDEDLNLLSKLGCGNTIFGSILIVIHAPREGQVVSLEHMRSMLFDKEFIVYVFTMSILVFILMLVKIPRHSFKFLVVNILICSIIGSFSVMCCKGIGLALNETLQGVTNSVATGLFWFLVLSVIITISLQMNFLNKALDIFDTTVVTPVYYVLFTSFVLIASAILFKEYSSMTTNDIIGSISGFFVIIIGIILINAFKEIPISLDTVQRNLSTPKNVKHISITEPLLRSL